MQTFAKTGTPSNNFSGDVQHVKNQVFMQITALENLKQLRNSFTQPWDHPSQWPVGWESGHWQVCLVNQEKVQMDQLTQGMNTNT